MADETFPYHDIRIYLPPFDFTKPDPQGYPRHREQEERDRKDANIILKMVTHGHAGVMAELAENCLRSGELQRGIQAVALAVAVNPANPAWRTLLDRYLDHAEEAQEILLPKRAFPWFLFNPIRAYFAQRHKGLETELAFVTGVVQSFPAREYLEYWVLPWLDRETIKGLQLKDILNCFSVLIGRYPEYGELSEQQVANLDLAVSRMRLVEEIHGFDTRLLVITLMALGKLGRFHDAIQKGRSAHEANPSWHTAIAVANAMKRAGRTVDAIEYFYKGSGLDKSDVSALLEIGDLCLAQKEWTQALQAYELALERHAKHPWADPSAVFCRYRLRGERSELARLRRMAGLPVAPCGVGDVLAAMTGETPPRARQGRAKSLLSMLNQPAS